jgi:hypothetical protein
MLTIHNFPRGALGGVLNDRLAAYHANLAARPAYQRAMAAMTTG